MSVKQMGLVWELDLKPNKRLVLLAYADHADHEGDNVYPSLARIAHKTGYSRDQVRRITKEIVQDGLMEVLEVGGGNQPNRCRLTLWRGGNLPPLHPQPTRDEPLPPRGTGARGGVALWPSPPGAPVPPEPSVEPSYNHHSPEGADATSNGSFEQRTAKRTSAKKKAKSPEDHTGKLIDDLEEMGFLLDRDHVEKISGNFGVLKRKGVSHAEMVRARQHMVAEWPRLELSPQRALRDIRGEPRSAGSREDKPKPPPIRSKEV